MPAKSENQQHYMGMQLAKAKAGKPTDVNMTMQQLEEFAKKPKGGYKKRKKKIPKNRKYSMETINSKKM